MSLPSLSFHHVAGEILALCEKFIKINIHPTVLVKGLYAALDTGVAYVKDELSFDVKVDNDDMMLNLISACVGTKFGGRWVKLLASMALKAVRTVRVDDDMGRTEIDIKRYARVEKIPGGALDDCQVLDGLLINKDIIHSKMRRTIEHPRIMLLDCALEYKKAESQTNVELRAETDFNTLLDMEDEWITRQCQMIVALKPDLVITEKGVSDLAQHFFVKHNISVIRRLRKTDNNRIARAVGARIVHRLEDLSEACIGTKCGLFEISKIGDEYFTFLTKCDNPKACTLLLRGSSKDVLNEIERNLHDAMAVARNLVSEPFVVAGGGATEMAMASHLREFAKTVDGVEKSPILAVAHALEVIPRTLAQNCGAKTIRVVTELRAKHAGKKNVSWGVHGSKGVIADMNSPELGVWEPREVKIQTFKTAVEAAAMMLRIDDVLSGISKRGAGAGGGGGAPRQATAEDLEQHDQGHLA